jgi:hypothetical protein
MVARAARGQAREPFIPYFKAGAFWLLFCNFVLALNWGTGTTRYQAANPNGGQFWSTPTLSSAAIYAGSMDGYLYSCRIP